MSEESEGRAPPIILQHIIS